MTRSSASFAVAVVLSASLARPAAHAADASARGPYGVGFLFLRELDGSRVDVSGSHRPVPLAIFYPADPLAAAGAPTAHYPRNPFTYLNPTFQNDPSLFPSTSFESQGLDPARQEPTPAAGGPFPLIVFSQGARAPYWYNVGLATRVAGHGFVVVLVAHYGELAYPTPKLPNPPPPPPDPLLHVAQRGLDRIHDMKFAIDRMLLHGSTAGDPLFGVVDGKRITVGGHSFGGLTAVQLVAGDDSVCDTYPAGLVDPNHPPPPGTCAPFVDVDHRVKALILFDPSTQNMHWSELQRVSIPSILVGEDFDSILVGFQGNTPGEVNMRAHHAFDGQPNYRVDVLHSRHVPSFTDACESLLVRFELGDINQKQFQDAFALTFCDDAGLTPHADAERVLWRYATAFAKTVLAGEEGYQNVLTPGWALTREPYAQFFVTEKRNGLTPDTEFPDAEWFFLVQPGNDDMPSVPEE